MSKKKTTTEFNDDAMAIHGRNYDYSKVSYLDARTNVEIVCPTHGSFFQSPTAHLSQKQGCPKCGVTTSRVKRGKTIKDFVRDAEEAHGIRYDYSLSVYVNSSEKVAIRCLDHGVFWQLPLHHLKGIGCPVCGTNRTANAKRRSKELFGSDARKVHGERYDYSRVRYISSHSKVEIVCRKHGSFKQTPASHISGRGCPICSESQGEKLVARVLDDLGIKYVRQKKFDGCRLRKRLCFDFYIPDFNVAIEFDGIQHSEPRDFGGSKESAFKEFEMTKIRDEVKNVYCEESGITLLRVNFICRDTIEERIRGVIYAKNRITAQVLGDETDDMVLRRLGPKDMAKLL